MNDELQGKKVAFMVSNEGVEEVELRKPWEALEQAGAELTLIAPVQGMVQAFDHLDKGGEYPVDKVVADTDVEEYDCLVLPGGVANPDQLRTDAMAISLIKDFYTEGKTVAAVCHAPWTLVEAGLVKDKTLTSWPSLHTDIENAGGHWVDEQVHIDDNLITARKPDDLEAFADAIIDSIRALPEVEGDSQIAMAPEEQSDTETEAAPMNAAPIM